MTEIETIARAQMYLEKLANGVNPLTDTEQCQDIQMPLLCIGDIEADSRQQREVQG